jgi:hypothetical protein
MPCVLKRTRPNFREPQRRLLCKKARQTDRPVLHLENAVRIQRSRQQCLAGMLVLARIGLRGRVIEPRTATSGVAGDAADSESDEEGNHRPVPGAIVAAGLVDVLGHLRRLFVLHKELEEMFSTCPICLDPMITPDHNGDDDPDVSVTRCLHFFHTDCVREWLSYHGTCPLCRDDDINEDLLYPLSSLKEKQHGLAFNLNETCSLLMDVVSRMKPANTETNFTMLARLLTQIDVATQVLG